MYETGQWPWSGLIVGGICVCNMWAQWMSDGETADDRAFAAA